MSYSHTNGIVIPCQEDKIKIAKEFCDSILARYKGNEIFVGDDGNYHFIYLTINTNNGKFYVGKHTTDSLSDGYIGSGHHLSKAISKYGKSSFTHHRLCFFSDSKDAYKEESFIVDFSYIETYRNKLQITYNLRTGGMGGTQVSEETRLKQRNVKLGKKMSLVARRKMSFSQIKAKKCPILRKRISEKAIESNNRPGAREKMSSIVGDVKSNRILIDLEGNRHLLAKEDVLGKLKQEWKFASNKAYLFHPELFKNKDSLRECDYYKSILIKDRFNEKYQYETIIDYLENGWVLGCPSKIESQIRLSEDEVKFYLEKNKDVEIRIKLKRDLIRKERFSIRELLDLEGNKQEVHIEDILECLKLGWKFPFKRVVIHHQFLNESQGLKSTEYTKTVLLIGSTVKEETQYQTLIRYLENGWGFGNTTDIGSVEYWVSKNKEIELEINERVSKAIKLWNKENPSDTLSQYNKSIEGREKQSARVKELYSSKSMTNLDGIEMNVPNTEILSKLKDGWTLNLKKARIIHPILIKDKSLKLSDYHKNLTLVREGRDMNKAIKSLIGYLEQGWEFGVPSNI
jgi:hypothetical protein